MKKQTLLLLAVFAFFATQAQKVRDHWINFDYAQLPLKPLDDQIASYQSALYSWEDEKAEELDAQYEQELANYRENYKIAQDQYQKELEEWNKKSRLEKIVDRELLEESKPVFNPPPYPDFEAMPESPDNEALASKYLVLDGYDKGNDTPVFITVRLKEIDLPDPERVTKTTGEGENKKTTTSYHCKYKQPVKLTVESSINGVLYDEVLPVSMKYYNRVTTSEPSKEEMKQYALNDLLSYTRNFINSQWGKKRMTHKQSIVLITKFRRYTYPEYEEALAHAISGYNNLYLDRVNAVSSLNKAINIWEKVLEEYDPNDKKARINREVAWYTMLNLGEAYMWIDDYDRANEYFSRMEATMPKWDRDRLKFSKNLLQERRERFLANQNR